MTLDGALRRWPIVGVSEKKESAMADGCVRE